MDEQELSRAGVIINPRAGRGNGKGLALAEKLGQSAARDIAILQDFGSLESDLAAFSKAGVTDIFISSGDGTVQAVQTIIAERRMFSSLPRLCLLPHGTTNMTAADLGFRVRSLDRQAHLIMALAPTEIKQRATIRVANPADGKIRHGMFIGTGAVTSATRYCQKVFNDRGVTGSFATFATLAQIVARALLSKADPSNPNRIDRPFDIKVESQGQAIANGQNLMALFSTLEKLILHTRPFWTGDQGAAAGAVRAAVYPYPLRNIARWILPAMYGGENRKLPGGYKSASSDGFLVTSSSAYVIDGEFFDGPAHEPLRIEAGPVLHYVVR
jgi:diacylglycerol kinase (ATP)